MQFRTFAVAILVAGISGVMPLSSIVEADDAPIAQPARPSFAPLVERTAPSVVNIYAEKVIHSRSATRYLDGSAFWRLFRDTLLFGYGHDRFENSLGSGVIVAANGVVVTNHHVVQSANGVLVALPSGQVYPARVLGSDPRTDLAVLLVDADGLALPTIDFGDSDRLKVGDQVIAIGNPFGLGQTVTSGIVSAVARTSFGVGDFRFFIQTDAAINPGNSGGALVAMDGKLVGINTAINSSSGGSQGLGFAIPSNMARAIVDSAVKGQTLVRPWIGLTTRPIPARLAALLGLLTSRGVFVTDVYKGGPADSAGLQQGDVVLAIDEFPIGDPQELRYRVATRMNGSMTRLTVERGGELHQVAVTLKPPPDEPPRNESWMPNLSPLRGAKVASLSPAFAEEIGVDSGISGVVILTVGVAAAAYRLGLREGDIIRAIDDRPVRAVDDLLALHVLPFKSYRITLERAGRMLAITRN
jgi:Do/DeqQ family serine protease